MSLSSTSSSTLLLSASEKEFIRDGCRLNCRLDGRACDEFGSYPIQASSEQVQDGACAATPLVLSHGSARLWSATNGCTNHHLHLLCSVKAEMVHPAPARPNQGVLEVFVERISSLTASTRRQDEHLQSLLSRLVLLQDDHEQDALCVIPGRFVWRLSVDVLIVAGMASQAVLVDASSHVIRAALQHTLLPNITVTDASSSSTTTTTTSASGNNTLDFLVDGDMQAAKPLSPRGLLARIPIVMTITILECSSSVSQGGDTTPTTSFVLVLDATAEEEACAHAQVHVAWVMVPPPAENMEEDSHHNEGVSICGITKTGAGGIPTTLLPQIIATAATAALGGRVQHAYHLIARDHDHAKQQQVIKPSSSTNHYSMLQEQFAFS